MARLTVCAWKPDLMAWTERRLLHVLHWRKHRRASFCSRVSFDLHTLQFTYSSEVGEMETTSNYRLHQSRHNSRRAGARKELTQVLSKDGLEVFRLKSTLQDETLFRVQRTAAKITSLHRDRRDGKRNVSTKRLVRRQRQSVHDDGEDDTFYKVS